MHRKSIATALVLCSILLYGGIIGSDITWEVVSGGGDIDGNSTNFRMSGTVGQVAIGSGGSGDFGLGHGFWQEFAVDSCDCRPGDANGDGEISVSDVVYEINYIFKGGPPPVPYEVCSGDANCSCAEDISDAVYKINYVFKGGPPPCTCEEWAAACGPLSGK